MIAHPLTWGLASLAVLGGSRRGPQPPADVLVEARRQLHARGRTDQAVRERFGEGGQVDSNGLQRLIRTASSNIA